MQSVRISIDRSTCGKLITNPFGAIERRYGNYLPTPPHWFHGRQAKSSRSADVRVELQNTKTLIGA